MLLLYMIVTSVWVKIWLTSLYVTKHILKFVLLAMT
jgi:hypothetical protein